MSHDDPSLGLNYTHLAHAHTCVLGTPDAVAAAASYGYIPD